MSETDRMDEFSDMDFFLIVDEGAKREFIESLDWLAVEPIVFSYRNTVDGHKALLANGVFAEFAVFEPRELRNIGFTKGNIIYMKEGFDLGVTKPRKIPEQGAFDDEYLVNEALTDIYIGVLRQLRGETAAAFMSIQVYAARNIMKLFGSVYEAKHHKDDPYAVDRRIETKFTETETMIAGLCPGYRHNLAAARFALAFIKEHFEFNQALVAQIETKIDDR